MVFNKDAELLNNDNNSWLLAYAEGSEFYIPGALHVERNDLNMLVENDEQASVAAEDDGVPLIYGMDGVPDRVYVDTSENRKIVSDMLRKHPEYIIE